MVHTHTSPVVDDHHHDSRQPRTTGSISWDFFVFSRIRFRFRRYRCSSGGLMSLTHHQAGGRGALRAATLSQDMRRASGGICNVLLRHE